MVAALAVARLVGARLLEQTDEWAVQRAFYTILETMRLSAMIRSLCCRRSQRHTAAQRAQERRSYIK